MEVAVSVTSHMTGCVKALGQYKGFGALAATLLVTGAIAGWGISTTFVSNAAAVETAFQMKSLNDKKAALVGSYRVTGTEPDGESYAHARIVDISLAPSGALELDWDNGRLVGVGQLVDNVLAVAYSIKGRTVISVMTINPDGTLSGNWLRRTDRGSRGTETWKKA